MRKTPWTERNGTEFRARRTANAVREERERKEETQRHKVREREREREHRATHNAMHITSPDRQIEKAERQNEV